MWNLISFIIQDFFILTFGRKNKTKIKFKNAIKAEKNQIILRVFQKLDKTPQTTGQIINHIQNIAQISHMFLILFSSLEISEIYACPTQIQLAHNHQINLAIIKTHKLELKANIRYQSISKNTVISNVLFLQILSDNFQKKNHQKNIPSENTENVNQT